MRGRWSQGRPVRSTHWICSLDRYAPPPLLLRIPSGDRTPAQPGGSPGVSPRHECARRSRLSNGHFVSECQCEGLPGILSTDQLSLSVGLVGKRHGDEVIGAGSQCFPPPLRPHNVPRAHRQVLPHTNSIAKQRNPCTANFFDEVARTELPPDPQADSLQRSGVRRSCARDDGVPRESRPSTFAWPDRVRRHGLGGTRSLGVGRWLYRPCRHHRYGKFAASRSP